MENSQCSSTTVNHMGRNNKPKITLIYRSTTLHDLTWPYHTYSLLYQGQRKLHNFVTHKLTIKLNLKPITAEQKHVSGHYIKIYPIRADRQGAKTKFLVSYNLKDLSSFQRPRNSEREFVEWNQLLCKSVLTPISCTKFKIYSTHADSPRAEINFFFSTIWKTSLWFTDQETQEENLLGGTNSFVDQFLHPSLVQS